MQNSIGLHALCLCVTVMQMLKLRFKSTPWDRHSTRLAFRKLLRPGEPAKPEVRSSLSRVTAGRAFTVSVKPTFTPTDSSL